MRPGDRAGAGAGIHAFLRAVSSPSPERRARPAVPSMDALVIAVTLGAHGCGDDPGRPYRVHQEAAATRALETPSGREKFVLRWA